MSENLSKQIKNYAIYLPSLPKEYAEAAIETDPVRNLPVLPTDLDFLKRDNKLFHYSHCLASAGSFARSRGSNSITTRDPGNTFVLGDSGGYQLGTGSFREAASWKKAARVPGRVSKLWLDSSFRHEMIYFMEANCTYATTLDVPPWTANPKSPFHGLNLQQYADLTVENLHLILKIRRHCKFLNVLQGENQKDADQWYARVREFPFEGWAYGTMLTKTGGLFRLLNRLLQLRHDKMLEGDRQWFHVLGVSGVAWGVVLTAIQKAIRLSTSAKFTVSFDSSTPFTWLSKNALCAAPPLLTSDLKTWSVKGTPFPRGMRVATQRADEPFPPGSPISRLLTLGDMNPNTNPRRVGTFDWFSHKALANHNLYVLLKAIADGNRVAFTERKTPQRLADWIGVIGDLFKADDWRGMLAKNERLLSRVVRAS